MYPSMLGKHLNRKTPCGVVVKDHELTPKMRAKPYGCHHCGRRFTSAQGLSQHIRKSCKNQNPPHDVTAPKAPPDEADGELMMLEQLKDTEIETLLRRFMAMEAALSALPEQLTNPSEETASKGVHDCSPRPAANERRVFLEEWLNSI